MVATGTFLDGETKIRPGVYFLIKALAQARVMPGARGRVALPVRADWGPDGSVAGIQEIADEDTIQDLYWQARAGNTVRLLNLAWQAAPKEILAYRLVGASGAAAAATLKDGVAANVVTLTALYKGSRPNAGVGAWSAVVVTNLDDSSKKDLQLMEGAVLLATWTFSGTPADLVAQVTADSKGYLTATKIADGNGTVANTAGVAFAGGDSGLTVTNQQYLDWLTALEAYKEFDTFSLDGVGDSSLQDSCISWLGRVRTQGLWVSSAFGAANDSDPTGAGTRATAINDRAVAYVASGGYLSGEATVYTPAEAAVWVAAKMATTALKDSFTGAATPFTTIGKRLTNTQIIAALTAGALVFDQSAGKVTVERARNTLVTPAANEDASWASVKVSTIIDAVNADLATVQAKFVGTIPNTAAGRKAIAGAVLDYFRTLAEDSVIDGAYSAGDDPATASAGGSAYLVVGYKPVDAVENIYNHINVAV